MISGGSFGLHGGGQRGQHCAVGADDLGGVRAGSLNAYAANVRSRFGSMSLNEVITVSSPPRLTCNSADVAIERGRSTSTYVRSLSTIRVDLQPCRQASSSRSLMLQAQLICLHAAVGHRARRGWSTPSPGRRCRTRRARGSSVASGSTLVVAVDLRGIVDGLELHARPLGRTRPGARCGRWRSDLCTGSFPLTVTMWSPAVHVARP